MAKLTLFRVHRSGIIELRLNHNGTHTSRSLGYRVEENQWRDGKVVNHPQRDGINISLASTLASAQAELLRIVNSRPTRSLSAVDLMGMIYQEEEEEVKEVFFDAFESFMHAHTNVGTRVLYRRTLAKVREFDCGATWDTIDKDWLNRFNQWMTRHHLSVNTRSIHLRNIRSVFNHGIDRGLTNNYPFRGYSIKSESVESRDLTPDQWRSLAAYAETAEGKVKRYLDIFILQFLLLGINIGDLYSLRPCDLSRGRIRYQRRKTGKKYNVNVHPMAATIIERYKGGEHLINTFDSVSYMWAIKEENRILKEVGAELGFDIEMTTYVSRYSWASIAYNELDISMEVISQALGHSFGLKVTQGYIDVNPKKVDEANERVIAHTFNYTSVGG